MRRPKFRLVFGLCVAVSLVMIAVALHRWGAAEIRTDADEALFLTLGGAVWLILNTKLFSWLGVSFRDDAVERRNVAALTALCGAVIAVALTYIGGSLVQGPSYLDNGFYSAVGMPRVLELFA